MVLKTFHGPTPPSHNEYRELAVPFPFHLVFFSLKQSEAFHSLRTSAVV